MSLFKKCLNKKYRLEPKGSCLLEYLFNKYYLDKEDYIEEYENAITNWVINSNLKLDEKAKRNYVILQHVLILLNILPPEEQEKYLFRIEDQELRTMTKELMEQYRKI